MTITLFLIYKQGIYLNMLPQHVRVRFLCLGDQQIKSWNKYMIILYKIFRKLLLTLNYLLSGKFIYLLFLNEKYDTEISFIEGETCLYVANSNNPSSRKISWIHTDIEKREAIPRKKEEKALQKMDEIICVSHATAQSLSKIYPGLKEKVRVIYNFIDFDEIINKSAYPIDINKDEIIIVSVGRLEKVKGYEILIRAHKKLIDEGVYHKLYIIGEGRERLHIEQLVKDLNLEDTVILTGFKENPYPYVNMADIFVVSSLYEGFSLALAEAVILEKPVISTKCAGPREILRGGEFGLMVNISDIIDLSEAMKKMILCKETRDYYTKQAGLRKSIFKENEIISQIKSIL